jgi:chemotaxis signal transduction protein
MTLKAGLECIVDDVRLVIPVESVGQFIDYDLTPGLPLSRAWVGGLGTHDGKLLLSVDLSRRGRAQEREVRTKGVVLNVLSDLDWVLEVREVASFVLAGPDELSPASGASTGLSDLPFWVSKARTEDDRSVGWLDVSAMIADLTSGGR